MKKYTIQSVLGQGSHAFVYLVKNENGEKFALKEFNLKNEDYEEVKQRYLSEKVALENINSKSVIKFIDAIETENRFAIVVELCEHGSLQSQLDEFGNFELNNCLSAGISILIALEALHQKGFIHRDIKPDNILQGEQGILKLADLGLVKGTGYESPNCQGSVDYMSPEQHYDYNNVDEKSDIYSLGASLYHLYTGSKVYEGSDIHEILDSHKNMIIPSVTEKRSECPESFNYIIRKMIAKKPMDRYHTAAEARLDLEFVLNGAESIQDLPSIKNILLSSSTSNPVYPVIPPQEDQPHTNKKNILLIATILATLVIISGIALSGSKAEVATQQQADPEKSALTEKEPKRQLEKEPEKKPEKEPENVVPHAPVKISPLNDIVYLGPNHKTIPVTLKKISNDLSNCELVYDSQTYQLIVGQSKNRIRLLSIENGYIIIDIHRKAYKILLNQSYSTKLNSYKIMKKNKLITINKNQAIADYTVSEVYDDSLILTDQDNKRYNFENSSKETINLFSPMEDSERAKLIESMGGILHFDKFDHYNFPFTLTAIAKSRIQVTNTKGEKSIHAINNILLNRLQLTGITSTTAKFKDIRTSKIYNLKKQEKIILRKAALVRYKNQTHKVLDQTHFLNYAVNFNDRNQIIFKSHKTQILSPSNNRIYLSKSTQNKSTHKVKDCPCFKKPVKVDNKPKPSIPEKNSQIPKPLNARNARFRNIDLDYLIKYCDLQIYRSTQHDESSSSASRLLTARYNGSSFYFNKQSPNFQHSSLTYKFRALSYNKIEFKKNNNELEWPIDGRHKYKINFIPNSYWSFKKMLDNCHAYNTQMIGDKRKYTSYIFNKSTLSTYIGEESKKAKFSYRFNDLAETIIINQKTYKIKIGLSSIKLVDSQGKELSTSFNNYDIIHLMK